MKENRLGTEANIGSDNRACNSAKLFCQSFESKSVNFKTSLYFFKSNVFVRLVNGIFFALFLGAECGAAFKRSCISPAAYG